MTPERLERGFAERLNGQLRYVPAGFASQVLAELEADGYAERLHDGSFVATDKARAELGEFWAVFEDGQVAQVAA